MCNGIVVVRAFIDFGCDGFFNPGTDWPLFGTTVTVRLPDGSTRVAVVDENGNAVLTGVNLGAGQAVTVTADNTPPAPTWVQQFGYSLTPCGGSPTSVTRSTSTFTLFGVTYVDFRYSITQ